MKRLNDKICALVFGGNKLSRLAIFFRMMASFALIALLLVAVSLLLLVVGLPVLIVIPLFFCVSITKSIIATAESLEAEDRRN